MQFQIENILLIASVLLFFSIVASKIIGRFGIPALLVFLGIGMLAGTDGPGGIEFSNLPAAQFLGVVALILILFSGGLSTPWQQVKPHLAKGIILSTAGVMITAVCLGLAAYYLTELNMLEAMLLGSVVSSTDAPAVFSLLRTRNLSLKSRLQSVLELESGSNDPMAYLLTIAFTSMLTSGESNIAAHIPDFLLQLAVGGLAGWVMAVLTLWMINRINLDSEGLYSVVTLSIVFLTYSITTLIGGNGFLAVYVTGLVCARSNFIQKRSITSFYDGQAWLMQIIMFIALGLLVFPTHMINLIPVGLLIAFILFFIARPIAVFICLLPFRIPLREMLFISWVGLKGAVPIIFAIYPLMAGVQHAEVIFNVVFFVVLLSVLIQGSSIPFVARVLKLTSTRNNNSARTTFPEDMGDALVEMTVPKASPVSGRRIVDIQFPQNSLIVLISRSDKYITPRGGTRLMGGDRLFILAKGVEDLPEIRETLGIILAD